MPRASPERPNILWLCTDQQRWDSLGCYGNGFVHTPNLDRLAASGVCFDHAFAQNPLCQPSRGSFLTGRYPVTTKLRQNGQDLPDATLLITKLLADQGYNCGLIGKLHLKACDHRLKLGEDWWRFDEKEWYQGCEQRIHNDGYADFLWDHAPNPQKYPSSAYSRWVRAQNGGQPLDESFRDFPGSKFVSYGPPTELHQTTWCCEMAQDFIRAHHDQGYPWLLSVNIFDPHPHYNPPAEYLERYGPLVDEIPLPNAEAAEFPTKLVLKDTGTREAESYHMGYLERTDRDHQWCRAAYWAMVDQIDRRIGEVLQTLETTGQLENTLVLFTSDHGELLGDHGVYPKGPFLYDPAVRVPLIFSMPGTIAGGRRSSALIELVDLAPTLLEAMGQPIHPQMQGRSIWSQLTSAEPIDHFRDDVYVEYYNSQPHRHDNQIFLTSVRTPDCKLVVRHGHNDGELYDLKNDPGERFNLWGDPAWQTVKTDMLLRLATRMAQTADPLPERVGIF
ncbi:MAG: sulfatase [Opitutales bacterium]